MDKVPSSAKEILPASAIDFICYKHQRVSLKELRFWLGDSRFLEFLTMFAGTYISIPTSKKIQELYYDYLCAFSVRRIKMARKARDLHTWSKEESTLHKIAKKTKRKYRSVYGRGEAVLRELERVKTWMKKMKIWENKYLKGDDDAHSQGSE